MKYIDSNSNIFNFLHISSNILLYTFIFVSFFTIPAEKRMESYNLTIGRRSILECDINPYELVSTEQHSTSKEAGITFVNGQRIRVRPSITEKDFHQDVQLRLSTPTKSSSKPSKLGLIGTNGLKSLKSLSPVLKEKKIVNTVSNF